jgi:hypothetical protein
MTRTRHPVARIPFTDGVERNVFQDKDVSSCARTISKIPKITRGNPAPDVALRVKAVTGNANSFTERETIMSLSSRTTRRFQVEQLESRLTPSTLHAAGALASAKPMVSDIVVTKPTDSTNPSLYREALTGNAAGEHVVIKGSSNGGGNTAALDKAFEIKDFSFDAEQPTGSHTHGAGAGKIK